MDAAVADSGRQLHQLGRMAGLSRNGRDHRQFLHDKLEGDRRRAAAAREHYQGTADRVEWLRQDQDAYEHFETAEGWRRADLVSLHHQVDRHWAEVVAACVVADDPLAYGIGQLRHARSTLESDRRAIDAAVPEDRADQWDQVRRQLPDVVRLRHQAEELVAQSQAPLQDARGRRWGRHDQKAVADAQAQLAAAEDRAQKATSAERHMRERLAALAEHHQQRQDHLADVAVPRQEIGTTLAQVDAALDRTRPDRVAALADDPPDHLVARIGPAPATLAGRAVWCHHALDIEAAFDRNDGASPPWTGWSPQTDLARRQIVIADRVLQASSDRPGPTEWAELAEQAGTVLDQVRRAERDRAARQRAPGQWQRAQPRVDLAAERPLPGISM
jgi:hypothetical protein